MKVLIVREAFNGKEVGHIESIVENNDPVLEQKNQHRFFANMDIINLPDELIDKPISVITLEAVDAFWSKEGESDLTEEPRIADHWIKDGVTIWDAPMIEEFWSKDGESDLAIQPLINKWTKGGGIAVFTQPMTVEKWTKDAEVDLLVDPEDVSWTHFPSVNDESYDFIEDANDESWAFTEAGVDQSYSHVPSVFDNSWSYSPAIKEGDFAVELDVAKDKLERIAVLKTALDTDLYIKMAEAYGTSDPISAISNYLNWLSMKSSPSIFASAGIKARFNIASVVAGDALNTDEEILEYANGLLTASDTFAVYREVAIQEYIVNKLAIEAE